MSIISKVSISLILIALSFSMFSALRAYPDPPGVDGYYYLKQIKVLAEGKGYYYKDYSFAFFLPAAVAYFIEEPLNAYRFSIALVWSFMVLGVSLLTYFLSLLSRHSTRTSFWMAFLSFFVLITALTIHEALFEYFKNLFSLLFIVAALVVWYRPSEKKWKSKLAIGLLLMIALLSHKSAFLFVFLFGFLLFLNRVTKRNFLIFMATGVIMIALFLAFFEKGTYYLLALPGFFGSPGKWFQWSIHVVKNDWALFMTFILAFLSIIIYVWNRKVVQPELKIFFDSIALFLVLCLFPFLFAGPPGPAYRMLILSPIFIFPLLLVCLLKFKKAKIWITLILIIWVGQTYGAQDRLSRHFTNWSSLNKDVALLREHVTARDYLIAQHGMEFYIDYQTGIRARQFANTNPEKNTYRIAYIPDGRPGGEAREALDQVKIQNIGEDYGLFKEEDWLRLVAAYHIKPHWKNPMVVRPNFIPDYE